jgi:hypothetical protein
MNSRISEIRGTRIFEYSAEGPQLHRAQDVTDLIGEALSADACVVLLPVKGVAPSFFQLRTGFAGEMLQKFANYQVKVAIGGDVSEFAAASAPLRDFIRESNRGKFVWFLGNREELEDRLERDRG